MALGGKFVSPSQTVAWFATRYAKMLISFEAAVQIRCIAI